MCAASNQGCWAPRSHRLRYAPQRPHHPRWKSDPAPPQSWQPPAGPCSQSGNWSPKPLPDSESPLRAPPTAHTPGRSPDSHTLASGLPTKTTPHRAHKAESNPQNSVTQAQRTRRGVTGARPASSHCTHSLPPKDRASPAQTADPTRSADPRPQSEPPQNDAPPKPCGKA